uniref:Uncharacterized protein n=1 Tax=Oryza brachyantha TaxID=4533 RepID=J3N9X1_ORYBR
MDAGAFAGDVPAGRRRLTLFGGNSPTNCLPGLSRAHFATLGEEEEEGCSVGDLEMHSLELELSFGKVLFIQLAGSDPEADEDK